MRFSSQASSVFAALLVALVIAPGLSHAGLVAHYPLDGDAEDLIAGNDGTLVGDVAPAADRFDTLPGALEFGPTLICPGLPGAPGGPGGYVWIPDAPQLNPVTAITLAAWLRVDAWCAQRRAISKGTGGLGRQYGFLVSADGLRFTVFGETPGSFGDVLTPPLPAGWHHVAGTYDGAKVRLYVDCAWVGETDFDECLNTGTDVLAIGNKSTSPDPDERFIGRVDDVRIYDEALSQSEIAILAGVENFSRGDCNNDGLFDIGDPIFTLDYLFGAGSSSTACMDACDGNDDGQIDLGDAIAMLDGLFGTSGSPLPSPFFTCGADSTPDVLDCAAFAGCPCT